MKAIATIHVQQKDLAAALKTASKISPTYNNCKCQYIPAVCSCVALVMGLHSLTIQAANNRMYASVSMDATCEGDVLNTVLLETQELCPIIRRLDNQQLSIYIYGHHVKFVHASGSFCLTQSEGVERFTEIVGKFAIGTECTAAIPVRTLSSIIRRLEPFCDTWPLRESLYGICIYHKKKTTEYMASNGVKLALIEQPAEEEQKTDNLVIPLPVVVLLRKILPRTGTANIYYDVFREDNPDEEPRAMIGIGRTRLFFRLAKAKAPRIDKIIPKMAAHHIRINRQTLLRAIERLKLFGPIKFAKISCQAIGDTLIMSTFDTDLAMECTETIPCEYNGPGVSFIFSPKPWLQILDFIRSTDVEICGNGPVGQWTMRPAEQTETETITTVLMPCVCDEEVEPPAYEQKKPQN